MGKNVAVSVSIFVFEVRSRAVDHRQVLLCNHWLGLHGEQDSCVVTLSHGGCQLPQG